MHGQIITSSSAHMFFSSPGYLRGGLCQDIAVVLSDKDIIMFPLSSSRMSKSHTLYCYI